jgi:hypothetical protein
MIWLIDPGDPARADEDYDLELMWKMLSQSRGRNRPSNINKMDLRRMKGQAKSTS